MAGEAHPVPFRTRKLSPPAPMVLRSQSVGEQGAADQRGAFARGAAPGGDPGGRPFLAAFFARITASADAVQFGHSHDPWSAQGDQGIPPGIGPLPASPPLPFAPRI